MLFSACPQTLDEMLLMASHAFSYKFRNTGYGPSFWFLAPAVQNVICRPYNETIILFSYIA